MNIITFKNNKYVLPNGLEFETRAEVKAFIKGVEFAQSNMNVSLNTVINNACISLK